MAEIDKVIDAHGGWPSAFQGKGAKEQGAESVLEVAEPQPERGSSESNGKP